MGNYEWGISVVVDYGSYGKIQTLFLNLGKHAQNKTSEKFRKVV